MRILIFGMFAGYAAAAFSGETVADNQSVSAGGHRSPESYPGMSLVWRDEFSGTQLDRQNWRYETGTGHNGWGNGELQYYRPENTQVQGGYLVITVRQEPFEGSNYTSSRIATHGKREFRHGRIDIRAKLPEGQGIWPALRMLGYSMEREGWPAAGEIDIMEMIGGQGRENTVSGTLHWAQDGGRNYEGGSISLPIGTFSDQFHVFSIEWGESSIRWLVDDYPYLELDTGASELDVFRRDFYLLINLAVGGRLAGSPDSSTSFPQRFIVDYVRVFR